MMVFTILLIISRDIGVNRFSVLLEVIDFSV
jgi:hypothetical protein